MNTYSQAKIVYSQPENNICAQLKLIYTCIEEVCKRGKDSNVTCG